MKYVAPRVAVLSLLAASLLPAQTSNATDPDFFETKVRPVLANNCFACHAESGLGGLRLDSEEAMKKGGMRGPAVIPGDPAKSSAENQVETGAVNFNQSFDDAVSTEVPDGHQLPPDVTFAGKPHSCN